MAKIKFFTENIKYNLKHKKAVKNWLKATITKEGYALKELNFIFCSDDYLLGINQTYLQHNDYTDVITFDNATVPNTIVGDIFISIDRVKENAALFNTTKNNELCRVMVHGTLHLLGYKDKTKATKTIMTAKENEYLALKGF